MERSLFVRRIFEILTTKKWVFYIPGRVETSKLSVVGIYTRLDLENYVIFKNSFEFPALTRKLL